MKGCKTSAMHDSTFMNREKIVSKINRMCSYTGIHFHKKKIKNMHIDGYSIQLTFNQLHKFNINVQKYKS